MCVHVCVLCAGVLNMEQGLAERERERARPNSASKCPSVTFDPKSINYKFQEILIDRSDGAPRFKKRKRKSK